MLEYPDPPQTDGVVVLRRWSVFDLRCVEEASSDPRIPEGTSVPPRYDEREGLAWIHRQWGRAASGEGRSLAIAEAASNEALGAVVLMPRPRPGSAGIGYWVVPRARQRGLASRAVPLLARWALTDGHLSRIEALVEPKNHPSRRVVEKAGFVHEARLRSYLVIGGRPVDVDAYSLLPGDPIPSTP